MKTHTAKVLAEGIVFGEGPRWHDRRLWFSDMHGKCVMTVTEDGRMEKVVEVEAKPSGLGWTTDDRLLIVSMEDAKLLRLDPSGSLTVHADLAPLVGGHPNDMVVDPDGRAFVGNFGFDLLGGEALKPANLICVEPDGKARTVAEDLAFPNGTVITPDRKTLIVAETFAGVLTAFNLKSDGSLSGRRFFAHLGDRQPDGICLDAEGCVWVSCFGQDEFIRVHEGGDIAERVPVPGKRAVACMLGGADGKTLFLLTAETTIEELAQGKSKGRVETVRVDVPGAGFP